VGLEIFLGFTWTVIPDELGLERAPHPIEFYALALATNKSPAV